MVIAHIAILSVAARKHRESQSYCLKCLWCCCSHYRSSPCMFVAIETLGISDCLKCFYCMKMGCCIGRSCYCCLTLCCDGRFGVHRVCCRQGDLRANCCYVTVSCHRRSNLRITGCYARFWLRLRQLWGCYLFVGSKYLVMIILPSRCFRTFS